MFVEFSRLLYYPFNIPQTNSSLAFDKAFKQNTHVHEYTVSF